MTRAQKLIMIRQVMLGLKLLNNDQQMEITEDTIDSKANTNLKNLPEEQLMLAVDGLAMICTYLYYGIGTPNSHLSNAPNAK